MSCECKICKDRDRVAELEAEVERLKGELRELDMDLNKEPSERTYCIGCKLLHDKESDPTPKSQCPKCREWVDDFDGFGVLVHNLCGYCSHPSSQGDDTGNMICDNCGIIVDKESE